MLYVYTSSKSATLTPYAMTYNGLGRNEQLGALPVWRWCVSARAAEKRFQRASAEIGSFRHDDRTLLILRILPTFVRRFAFSGSILKYFYRHLPSQFKT